MISLILNFFLVSANSQATCQDPPLRAFNFSVVSNLFTQILSTDLTIQGQAVHCWVHPAWTASIPGATWIWDKYKDDVVKTVKFQVQLYITGTLSYGILRIAADNYYSVTLNNQNIGCTGSGFSLGGEKNCNVLNYLVNGINTAIITVTNTGGPGALLYRLDVTSQI